MQAPVLSKSQVRKAISKKVTKKKSVRNVLSKPKTLTWPLIGDENADMLLTGLKNILYYKHNVRTKWNDIKKFPREQRRKVRQEIMKNEGGKKPEAFKSLIIGINAVTRALENNLITSVIISSDVNPIEMVKHIWQSCVNSYIPIIFVPSLRAVMKVTIGFPAIIMGFKNVPIEHPLDKIYKLVCLLSTKFTGEIYPHVETIEINDTLTYPCIETIELDDTIIDPCIETIVLDDTIEPDTTITDQNMQNSDDDDDLNDTISIQDSEENATVDLKKTENKNVLLYRSDNENRCFVPPKSENNITNNIFKWNTDFIGFSENMDTNENTIQTTNETPKISVQSDENIKNHGTFSAPQQNTTEINKTSSQLEIPQNTSEVPKISDVPKTSSESDDKIKKIGTLSKPLEEIIGIVNKQLSDRTKKTKQDRKNRLKRYTNKYSPVNVKRLQSNPDRKKK